MGTVGNFSPTKQGLKTEQERRQPGHSVNTEPIDSVLRYLDKFDSSETGTDRFLKNRYRGNSVSVNSVRFWYLPNSAELVTEKM